MPIKIKLETKTNKKAEQAINNLKDGYVKIGWFEGQKEPNGLLVAENAYLQEHGFYIKNKKGKTLAYVPPRPFLQITMTNNASKWNNFWKKEYKKVVEGKEKLKKALNELGIVVKEAIQRTLRSNVKPELKKSTIKARQRKGNYRTTTLMDSETMYKTINYKSEVGK